MIITDQYLPNRKWCAFADISEKSKFNSWPNEKGATPRDLSLGYMDNKDFGRLHVYPMALFNDKMKQNA